MISEYIAIKIVKRTMAILNVNVNIMNRDGVIIGSGDASRLGQVHTGAKKVLEQQTTIEIHDAVPENWSGTLPGINLPIRFQQEVVGVIGITGYPDAIRGYSQLVQMGAELILEQEFLTKEMQRHDRIREDVLSQMLLAPENELDSIVERVQSLNINIEESYAIILLSVRIDPNTDEFRDSENEIRSLIGNEDELLRLHATQYVILKKKRHRLKTIENVTTFINQKISTHHLLSINIALSPFTQGVQAWRKAFNETKTTLKVAESLYSNRGVWHADDLQLEIMCYRLAKAAPEEAMKQIDAYKRLFTEKEGAMLHETLVTYMYENGKAAHTAKKLFIHRNTLTYRLEKVHTITGKDPKNFRDLTELYMGQILYQMMSKNGK